MTEPLEILAAETCSWDLVALGEVMLRLDPGDVRIATARSFHVWEGGGEYNVARGLRKCFGLRTTIVTALADNPVGRLVEDLMLQGGVDVSHIAWIPYDGMGRAVRNGLNFTERGFGIRGPSSCSDRGHTAVSQLQGGDVDWARIFGAERTRWLHCGGIFAGLSDSTADVAFEAMKAARHAGVVVSYDLNYRPSIWEAIGGSKRAIEVNRRLASLVDVMFGNEEDFHAGLGYEIEGESERYDTLDPESYADMLEQVVIDYPNVKVAATSLRRVRSASLNGWGGLLFTGEETFERHVPDDIQVLDRIGGGDSFASGVIYGFLVGLGPQETLDHGVAHGALAMTTPGDTSMATLAEVQRLAAGGTARVRR